jgi:hypothetical protein
MNPETIAIRVRHYNKPYGLFNNTGAETAALTGSTSVTDRQTDNLFSNIYWRS